MCNILRFLPNQMMDEEKFFNCVWNNWHSYGLILKDGQGGMDVIKVVPESGENDPKEIWQLIKDNMAMERILHVRHTTAGVTDLDNAHPISVLYIPRKGGRKAREIQFMHNGTMAEYKSRITEHGVTKDDNTGPSDTRNFVDQILTPVCQADYGTGAGDLSNPILQKILQKFWPFSNRGVLIANDQPSFFLGDWKEFGVGDIIKVANVDYFDKVQRGPEFDRRKKADEEAKAREPSSFRPFDTSGVSYGNLKDFDFTRKHDFYSLSESAVNILSDWEVYDRSSAVSVGLLKHEDLLSIYADKTTCLTLMDWIFTDYHQLYTEHLKLEEKHQKASNKIAELVEENRTQEVHVG